ncbi:replication initiator protein [Capybara microvirus Cap1_SP_66]|nr:replication initiator protein [Capybara microvirus Cap1_SP_66]
MSCSNPTYFFNKKFIQRYYSLVDGFHYHGVDYPFKPSVSDVASIFDEFKAGQTFDFRLYLTGAYDGDYVVHYPINPFLVIPCHNCPSCLHDKQATKSALIALESVGKPSPLFVTLTYADEPINGVSVRDVQLFLKRLRKMFPQSKIRYHCTAEYGSHTYRPHYHLLIFGLPLESEQFVESIKSRYNVPNYPVGYGYYLDYSIRQAWQLGITHSRVVLNPAVIRYVSKYTSKQSDVLLGKNPPFMLQSTHNGGLGASVLRDYIINNNFDSNCGISLNGRYFTIPSNLFNQRVCLSINRYIGYYWLLVMKALDHLSLLPDLPPIIMQAVHSYIVPRGTNKSLEFLEYINDETFPARYIPAVSARFNDDYAQKLEQFLKIKHEFIAKRTIPEVPNQNFLQNYRAEIQLNRQKEKEKL